MLYMIIQNQLQLLSPTFLYHIQCISHRESSKFLQCMGCNFERCFCVFQSPMGNLSKRTGRQSTSQSHTIHKMKIWPHLSLGVGKGYMMCCPWLLQIYPRDIPHMYLMSLPLLNSKRTPSNIPHRRSRRTLRACYCICHEYTANTPTFAIILELTSFHKYPGGRENKMFAQ